jgi:hypothetical protein
MRSRTRQLKVVEKFFYFSLDGIVGGGVQLGPLGTAATNMPTVPSPGDYDDEEIGGMMNGRGNRSTMRKPAPVPICPTQTLHAFPDASPGRPGGKPAKLYKVRLTQIIDFSPMQNEDSHSSIFIWNGISFRSNCVHKLDVNVTI